MKKLMMRYTEPGMKVHECTVQGPEVITDEDGEFTFIRSLGDKPSAGGSRPVLEDYRVITARVIVVHESTVS